MIFWIMQTQFFMQKKRKCHRTYTVTGHSTCVERKRHTTLPKFVWQDYVVQIKMFCNMKKIIPVTKSVAKKAHNIASGEQLLNKTCIFVLPSNNNWECCFLIGR